MNVTKTPKPHANPELRKKISPNKTKTQHRLDEKAHAALRSSARASRADKRRWELLDNGGCHRVCFPCLPLFPHATSTPDSCTVSASPAGLRGEDTAAQEEDASTPTPPANPCPDPPAEDMPKKARRRIDSYLFSAQTGVKKQLARMTPATSRGRPQQPTDCGHPMTTHSKKSAH